MTALPIRFLWRGDAFEPIGARAKAECDANFVIGAVYALEKHQDRSEASHRHYFAAINNAWASLSEEDAERFPTPEALRKWALIKGGYRDERSIVCSSKAEAQRLAAFIKPMDIYAVVTVINSVVRVYTAKSQSLRAMGAREFQESKDVVLGYIADMIGVTPEELGKHTGRAA